MKRYVLLLSVFLNVSVFSQPYLSIYGDSSTTWSIVKQGACDYVCSAFYSPTGDTTINSTTYSILPNYGFIREDSAIGKVWFFDEYWNQEFLVMDMSLNVSDEFTIYDWFGNAQSFIVDSINFQAGKKHIYLNGRINICGMEEPLLFVEGSGPNAGFNFQKGEGGNFIRSYMLCQSKDDSIVQSNVMFMDSCEICTIGLEELGKTPKELIKVCDYLGRETPVKKNTPLIYFYSDGTIRRVLIVD